MTTNTDHVVEEQKQKERQLQDDSRQKMQSQEDKDKEQLRQVQKENIVEDRHMKDTEDKTKKEAGGHQETA